ncbi:unnamed protein product [Bathycoccus prasinos]
MAIKFILLAKRDWRNTSPSRFQRQRSDNSKAKSFANPLSRGSDYAKGMHAYCAFLRHNSYKICYRRYASLFFIVGVDDDENELSMMDFIHCFVETLDWHFGNVCELDIMFHLDSVYVILDEMVCNGQIVETNKRIVLGEASKFET